MTEQAFLFQIQKGSVDIFKWDHAQTTNVGPISPSRTRLKPIGRQRRVPGGSILDIAVPEVGLQRPGPMLS
jgi:hypothetical protein